MIHKLLQEMFDEIDKEEDGEVYYREVVDYLKSVNQDMDYEINLKVCVALKQHVCGVQSLGNIINGEQLMYIHL
jgi:predicted RNA-binding protein Jag